MPPRRRAGRAAFGARQRRCDRWLASGPGRRTAITPAWRRNLRSRRPRPTGRLPTIARPRRDAATASRDIAITDTGDTMPTASVAAGSTRPHPAQGPADAEHTASSPCTPKRSNSCRPGGQSWPALAAPNPASPACSTPRTHDERHQPPRHRPTPSAARQPAVEARAGRRATGRAHELDLRSRAHNRLPCRRIATSASPARCSRSGYAIGRRSHVWSSSAAPALADPAAQFEVRRGATRSVTVGSCGARP